MKTRYLAPLLSTFAAAEIAACDLCAINNATGSRTEAAGFVFTLGEQFIYAHTAQLESEEVTLFDEQYLDTSVTHLIPTYNFNRDFGINLNVPLVRKTYRRYEFPTNQFVEDKTEGLGDLSFVLRYTPFSVQKMSHGFRVNVLAGVKFPTGDPRYVRQDVAEEIFMDRLLGAGHSHAFTPVHLHEISLGSGSYDGVFGVTANGRWKRLFATAEAQYYLRTQGEADFEFGDEVMISGGPGVYLILKGAFTLNLQAVMRYEHTDQATYFGHKPALQTGMREIYAGPEVGITAGQHFSAKVGADLPVDIRNNGFQIVPDYRVHGSLTWSF